MPEFKEPDHESVRRLLRTMAGLRILVVGDGMLDRYIYGASSRISPEAPVQIVHVEREENLLGGAANVAKCLVALGADVALCCIAGNDVQGEQFIAEAGSLNIDTSMIKRHPCRPTPVKTRIVAGRQHLLRVDREGSTPYPPTLLEELASEVADAADKFDGILLSDYAKGVLSEIVCKRAIAAAAGKPVLIDPKGTDWGRYAGATVLKPNWIEGLAMTTEKSFAGDDRQTEALARRLQSEHFVANVLLTRGAHGVSVACANGSTHSFAARAAAVQDEAGAGDTVAATVCLALAAGASVPMAAWLGNIAAGAKVAKFGTHTVSDHDILEMLGERFPSSERKLLSTTQAAQKAAALRGSGKKVVFTNGCFDLLHLGHVTYLEASRRLGDALLVGINTDASVRRLKGPERPVQTEGDRARIIASQECVDGVILFEDDTPLELIKAIKPDILCKGADYKTKEAVVGWDVVEAYGGRVKLIDLIKGRSTSNLIDKTKKKKLPVQSKPIDKKDKTQRTTKATKGKRKK